MPFKAIFPTLQKWTLDSILCCIIYHFITKTLHHRGAGGCLEAFRQRSQLLHADLAPLPCLLDELIFHICAQYHSCR